MPNTQTNRGGQDNNRGTKDGKKAETQSGKGAGDNNQKSASGQQNKDKNQKH